MQYIYYYCKWKHQLHHCTWLFFLYLYLRSFLFSVLPFFFSNSKKLLPVPALVPPILCWKNLKPSPKPHRRHNSLLVVLFCSVVNCVASQAESLYQDWRRFYYCLRGIRAWTFVSKLFRVGISVEGASSAGTKRVTPERAWFALADLSLLLFRWFNGLPYADLWFATVVRSLVSLEFFNC